MSVLDWFKRKTPQPPMVTAVPQPARVKTRADWWDPNGPSLQVRFGTADEDPSDYVRYLSEGAVPPRSDPASATLPAGGKSKADDPFPVFDRSRMPAFEPDLIPATSWGSSLANLLSWQSWNAIRELVIDSRHSRCQLCGETPRKALEVHELWAYSLPPSGVLESFVGVQRLMGLASLCHDCHECFHYGYAKIRGRGDVVRQRMQRLNRWTWDDFNAWHSSMGRRYQQRCERNWILDLTLVKGFAPLVVAAKKGWTRDQQGLLTRPAHLRGGEEMPQSQTLILGCSFVLGGVRYDAHDPTVAYNGLLPEAGDFAFVRSMGTGLS